jgi:hypothetical protein
MNFLRELYRDIRFPVVFTTAAMLVLGYLYYGNIDWVFLFSIFIGLLAFVALFALGSPLYTYCIKKGWLT